MDAIRHTTSLLAMPPAKWRLWIGALALIVQLLMPVQHVLARGGDADDQAVLCTSEGSIIVNLADLDGTPAPAGKSMAGMLCPLCAFGGTQVLLTPEAAGFAAPRCDASTIEFEARQAQPAGNGGSAAYGSRAPPLSI
jgi:hypothetical protein